jgi:hypothetical protein
MDFNFFKRKPTVAPIDNSDRVIEQTNKYLFVSVRSEFGLRLADIERIELKFSGEYVDSQHMPISGRIHILLRKTVG